MLPQFTCSEKSRHQEILARALHLVCSSLKELSSCVLWVSCTLSRILYKLHKFFLWEECMEKKNWRSNILLALKHVLYRITHFNTWKVGDEWSLNDSIFITWVNDLYVRYTSETWNLQCQLICVYSLWVDDFFFISIGTKYTFL